MLYMFLIYIKIYVKRIKIYMKSNFYLEGVKKYLISKADSCFTITSFQVSL